MTADAKTDMPGYTFACFLASYDNDMKRNSFMGVYGG